MMPNRATLSGLLAAGLLGSGLVLGAQSQAPLPVSPTIRGAGQAVYGAYEGWYKNPDGTFTLLVGYFNRNDKQELDIPVGPNNRIEPGGPDLGQPTHFGPRRAYGIFGIVVPKDFGSKKLTWTLVANGQTTSINMHLDPNWVVEPFEDAGSKNKPPEVRFTLGDPAQFGPPTKVSASYTTIVNEPVEITAYVRDEAAKMNVAPPPERAGISRPAMTVTWSKFRGLGDVKFDPIKPKVDEKDNGKASTQATFSAPGEYILRLQANDVTGDGGGGFQCCWTNAHVKVTVKPTPHPAPTGGQ